jgi:RIO kinase 1
MEGQFDDADEVPEVTKVVKKTLKKKSKTPAVVAVIAVSTEDDDSNANGDNADYSFDALESMLLNDGSYTGGAKGSIGGTDFGKKINLSTRVENDITRSEKKGEKRVNDCGRDDRATSEQVLDPRTRLILFKLLNNGFLSAIDGCLSTGKEANVYYARGEQGQEYAVKIFKTSILVFKDRDRYVSGEYRFRNGYCKSNPRKMVKTWAEKEMRNLKRLVSANVPCPTPHLLKSHVLVMDFLGKDGWCAPRLKEATLNAEQLYRCPLTVIEMQERAFN